MVGGGSGTLTLFDLFKGEERLKIPSAHVGPITTLCVSEDGDFVVTGGEDRRVVVWSVKEPGDED